MISKQLRNTVTLYFGQLLIKGSNFIKQVLLAFFLGVSSEIDLLLVAQIIPAIISSMLAGGAGELLVTAQKKGNVYNNDFVTLFVFVISVLTILIGFIYLGTIPVLYELFDISNGQKKIFWTLSILVIISKIPSSIVSSLQHLLYVKDKYLYYVMSTFLSEFTGVVVIIAFVKSVGILAFGYALVITPIINALFFSYAHRLEYSLIFKKSAWINNYSDLIIITKKMGSLSVQTLLNHLTTFWERTLSMRYLSPGYLSSLNYSKSLAELPRMAMLSSILTTSYIEQVNKKTDSENTYMEYSGKIEKLLNEISFFFQILNMLFAPLLIILVYKRGAFDSNDVESTFIIYQILTLGFIPGLMMNFFTRTMYIEEEYKKLFLVIIVKFIIEITLMILLITQTSNAIPIALVSGKFFVSTVLFILLNRKRPNMFNKKVFYMIYSFAFISSLIILNLNQKLLPILLKKPLFEVILLYSPVAFICVIITFFLLKNRYSNHFTFKFLKYKRN